jgi:hypothetical protein
MISNDIAAHLLFVQVSFLLQLTMCNLDRNDATLRTWRFHTHRASIAQLRRL